MAIHPSNTDLLWTHNVDSERVYPIAQAIEIYAEECLDNDEQPLDAVKMHAYEPKKIGAEWYAEHTLECLIENLDEEYGHLEDATEITQPMKDAALAFVRAVTAEYKVWQHEPIGSVAVKVSDYWSE